MLAGPCGPRCRPMPANRQILFEPALNARDAMPAAASCHQTANVELDANYAH